MSTLQNNWGLNNLATDADAFVLPISGKTGTFGVDSWNGNLCCCWSTGSDGAAPSDSDYIANLVQHMIDAGWPIDPKRVFGLGESAGEGVLARSACDHATVWAGVFGFSGAPGVTTGDAPCTPNDHVSFAHAHGTSDASAEPYTGTTSPNAGMPNACNATVDTGGTMDQLRAFNGCGTLQLTTSSWADLDSMVGGNETDLYDATSCPVGGTVELWKMNGTTHTITPTATFETKIIAWMQANPKP